MRQTYPVCIVNESKQFGLSKNQESRNKMLTNDPRVFTYVLIGIFSKNLKMPSVTARDSRGILHYVYQQWLLLQKFKGVYLKSLH